MIPLLWRHELQVAEAEAIARVGHDALIRRAGTAVGRVATTMLDKVYGARILVIAGPGHNGDDGRVAAAYLQQRGARVEVCEVSAQPARVTNVDLLIDAAFGTGLRRPYVAPEVGEIPVLAVDVPSGIDVDTGALLGSPVRATVTVALGALKPAHLVDPAASYSGEVIFEDLGLVTDGATGVVEAADLADFIHVTDDDHKWRHAVAAFAGSNAMPGAADLVARGAFAAGASMVVLTTLADAQHRTWSSNVVDGATTPDPRCAAAVVGPGLGRSDDVERHLVTWLASALVPTVIDADAIHQRVLMGRPKDVPYVVTPHYGEVERLLDHVTHNPLLDAPAVAAAFNVVVLLKGPVTVVADPFGHLLVVTSGTPALAVGGTGDTLAGMIAATMARGHEPLEAAATAAYVHGVASERLLPYGDVLAMDASVRQVLEELWHAG